MTDIDLNDYYRNNLSIVPHKEQMKCMNFDPNTQSVTKSTDKYMSTINNIFYKKQKIFIRFKIAILFV